MLERVLQTMKRLKGYLVVKLGFLFALAEPEREMNLAALDIQSIKSFELNIAPFEQVVTRHELAE